METVLKIGGQQIWPNVIPSPMSGVTDRPFRRLLRELAGGRIGLSVTEFVSVDSPPILTSRNLRIMSTFPGEKPFCVQLFGGDPRRVAEAAACIEGEIAPDFLEINSGCPMPKVIGRGAGANLLRDLPRLKEMLRRTRAAVRLPLFLKIRIGWDEQSVNVMEVARLAEEEGVAMLSIHGRTRRQGYCGRADWTWIEKAAASVSIPVIGNGDIRSAEEAWTRWKTHGVAGVGIGRALMHNPWIMGQVADLWEGKRPEQPGPQEQWAVFRRYLELLIEDGCPRHATIGRMKQIAARITRYVEPDISEIRQDILRAQTIDALMERVQAFYEEEYHRRACRFFPGRIENLNGNRDTEIQEGFQFR